MDKSIEFLNNNIKDNDTLVLACSGGPDSMCLFDLVDKLNKHNKIIVVSVNHNVREESSKELEYVKRCTLDKNNIFEELTIPKNDKYTEEDYRNIRYDFFREIIKKYNANILLTAHHGDDLIETVLMRIARGSDLNGYSGIKAKIYKENYIVLRPLIFVSKNEILKYNEENNIKYFNDYTNDLDLYTRNRYRHHILPFLKSEDENIHEKFLRYSLELQKNDDFINSVILKQEKEIYEDNKININKFNQLDDFVKEKIIKRLLSNIYKEKLYYIKDSNVDNIIDILNNYTGNMKFDLPYHYIGVINYDKFYIMNNKTKFNEKIIFNDEILINDNYYFKKVDKTDDKSNYVIKLDSKEIDLPLYFRSRTDGDLIEVKGLNGSKKIKDIYIDEKVDYEQRENLPLLVDSKDRILWVPGIKKSKFDKDFKDFYDIIIKYEKETGNE